MFTTIGVKTWADEKQGYWFLDIIGTEVCALQKQTREYNFFIIFLTVKDEYNWTVEAYTDYSDDDQSFNKKNLKYIREYTTHVTDMPPGQYKFYLIDGIMLLPEEY